MWFVWSICMSKCIVDVCICLCWVLLYERYMCKSKYVCVCFLSHLLPDSPVAQQSIFSVSFGTKLSMASCSFPDENNFLVGCFYQAGVEWF